MCPSFLVAVEIELCGRQIGRGVESEGQVRVREGIDESYYLQALFLSLRNRAGERDGKCKDGGGRRRQRVDAERSSGIQGLGGPVAHRLVFHAVEAIDR